ncbi:hypothetical protein ACHAXH_002765 [Discostella pseudostelligera]
MHLPWPSLALAAALAINSKSIAAFTPPSSATISSSSSLKSVGTSTPATFFLLHARKAQNSNNEDANDEDVKREKVAVNPAKRAALDGVLQRIERNYGRGSIVMLGNADRMNVDCIGTGSMTLDTALGGGYPKGRVIEIYGPESSGKTTLALHALAEVQQSGGTAAFVDAEHALDPAYAKALGVDIDSLLVSQPDSGEMALDIVDQLVRSAAVDVIVVDSVAALVPRAELEGAMSDMQVGLQARLMSKALRKITSSLSLSQCTVIFLNQLRSKVGVIYGSPEVTSGGNSLKFYASVRLDTRRREVLPDNMGIRVKVKVVKNKVAAPFKTIELDILFGEGIDKMGSLLDAALDLGVVSRRGSWYNYQDSNFAQGRVNASEYLKENRSVAKKIEEGIREAMLMAKSPAASKGGKWEVDSITFDDDLDSSIVAEGASILE